MLCWRMAVPVCIVCAEPMLDGDPAKLNVCDDCAIDWSCDEPEHHAEVKQARKLTP